MTKASKAKRLYALMVTVKPVLSGHKKQTKQRF